MHFITVGDHVWFIFFLIIGIYESFAGGCQQKKRLAKYLVIEGLGYLFCLTALKYFDWSIAINLGHHNLALNAPTAYTFDVFIFVLWK